MQISFVQRRIIEHLCLHLPPLNGLVLSVVISAGSSFSKTILEKLLCLLFKEKTKRSMSLLYEDAETD